MDILNSRARPEHVAPPITDIQISRVGDQWSLVMRDAHGDTVAQTSHPHFCAATGHALASLAGARTPTQAGEG